ncbi:MAG: hypothetical protein UY93_C0002G0388 [Parcubacteria group bacterium GW2011_GWA1_56_13]|nr:MAG: hypothetical protein UY93_C0002G0388 [Parcubacteria group bacterium GW2011_GWA1_56_13]
MIGSAVALFFLASTLSPTVIWAVSKQGYTPSGLVDTSGNVLYVESSTTPDVYRAAPIPSSTFTTSPTFSALSTSSLSTQSAAALGPNLIPNPSLETSDASGLPTGWKKGGYGTNTRVLTYPTTPAQDGARAAQASITAYTSGDAKWYFNHIPVTAGQTYQFSDWSFSNVSSEVDVQVKMNDGTFRYIVLAHPGPSASYQNTTAQFTVPAGAVSLTVFHVIKQVGSLTVDNYSLNQVTSGNSGNLVVNGDFETVGSGSLPANWNKGGWGTNTRSFSYPVSGVGGSKAARVSITNYASGDAKWYFTPLSLASGFYTYADSYQSNIQSIVVAQYHRTDGTFTYDDLATAPPASTFTRQSVNFAVPAGTQDVTVFRVIKGVGTLTLDNVSIVPSTNTAIGAFPNGAVTLSFDDGWLSQYQNAIPSMNAHGFKGTFYIVSHRFADTGFPGFMSKTQIQDLFRMGHEISAHTETHPHLTQLTAAEQQQEISGSRQDLLAMNVGPINAFAYPYGEYDSTTIQIVKDAGFSSARSTINGYATAASDHYQLPRQVILNTTTASQVRGWVDQAVSQKSWLIIAVHQVDGSGEAYSTTPATFGQIVDYLAQKGVPVITIDQGVQKLAP